MFEGLNQAFGLKANFDTGKIESGNYGFECWKVFWDNFDMKTFEDMFSPKLYFFCGDVDSNVYAICVETMAIKPENRSIIDKIAENLSNSDQFEGISASPGIERYDNSMAFDSFSPFIQTIELQWGNIKIINEAAAFDAMEALKIYKPE